MNYTYIVPWSAPPPPYPRPPPPKEKFWVRLFVYVKYLTAERHVFTMFVTIHALTAFHMNNLRIKFHFPICNGSLVIDIILKSKWNVRNAAILLYYIPQKHYANRRFLFSKGYCTLHHFVAHNVSLVQSSIIHFISQCRELKKFG